MIFDDVFYCIIFKIIGEDPLMYLYLQKRFSWTLDDYTLFNVYATLLSGSFFGLFYTFKLSIMFGFIFA